MNRHISDNSNSTAADRFALRVVARLDQGSNELPYDIAERLRAGRMQALDKRKRPAVVAQRPVVRRQQLARKRQHAQPRGAQPLGVPLHGRRVERNVGAVAGRDRTLSPQLRAFVDELADRRLWDAVTRLAV